MLKLPTNQEIKRAAEQWSKDGLAPLGFVIDDNRCLTGPLEHIKNSIEAGQVDLATGLKSIMVLSLNLGIRIGENRRDAASQTGL